MGLASINSPLLVSATGVGALAGLPTLETAIRNGAVSFLTIKVANAVLFALNLYAVQQPGRLDGKLQQDIAKAKKSGKEPLFFDNRGRSLVFPSGWAFAVWGVIFLGELVFCSSSLLVQDSSAVAAVIKKVSSGFMMGQIFQVLWTASFRPKYEGKLGYISAAMLSGIAWSLSRAHAGFVMDRTSYGLGQYLLYFFPMSLHFGWTMCASIVNLNGNIAEPHNVSAAVVAGAGHLSVLAATGLGVSLTLLRRAPMVGAVISWALAACCTSMKNRLEKAQNVKDQSQVGLRGAHLQKWLCGIGSILSASAAIAVALGVGGD